MNRIAAGMLSAAYLLNTYTAKTTQYVFHVEALYPFAVFLLVLGLQKARPGVTVLAAVLLFSIKEDSVLASSGVALALMLARPARPRAAAWLFAAGIVLYLVSSQIVMPAASGSRPQSPRADSREEAGFAVDLLVRATFARLMSPPQEVAMTG
jgi:uncharacterized membrane protein